MPAPPARALNRVLVTHSLVYNKQQEMYLNSPALLAFSLSHSFIPRVSASRSIKAPVIPALKTIVLANVAASGCDGRVEEGRRTGFPLPFRGSLARRFGCSGSRRPSWLRKRRLRR
jgi:hypothetical protein